MTATAHVQAADHLMEQVRDEPTRGAALNDERPDRAVAHALTALAMIATEDGGNS